MQKQIDLQETEQSSHNPNNYGSSPGSWSQLFNQYKRIINTKRKTENFIETVSAQVLIAMSPAIMVGLFSLTSVGVNVYTFAISLFISLILIGSTSYKTSSLMNIHLGALYIILPTMFVIFNPIFYAACAVIGVIHVSERFKN